MIVCARCNKENQDHYKFCLGCGAEMPKDGAPKAFTPPTPPSGFTAGAPAGAGQRPPAAAPAAAAPVAAPPPSGAHALPAPVAPQAAGASQCGKCGAMVNAGFKFCGTCGAPMGAAAPAPAAAPSAPPGPAAIQAPAAAPPAPAAAAPAPTSTPKGFLTLIRPDGSEGDRFPFGDGTTVIGRDSGALFAADAYLSPKHATLVFKNGQLAITDGASLNCVYVKVQRETPVELIAGSIFRVGQEVIRFDAIPAPAPGPDGVERMGSPNPGFIGKISLVIGRDSCGNAFPIPPHGLHLGRERGDVIFPDDGYVSGLHCRVHSDGGKIMLTDVGSSNGTFLRIRSERIIKSGDLILLGQQLFRVQY